MTMTWSKPFHTFLPDTPSNNNSILHAFCTCCSTCCSDNLPDYHPSGKHRSGMEEPLAFLFYPVRVRLQIPPVNCSSLVHPCIQHTLLRFHWKNQFWKKNTYRFKYKLKLRHLFMLLNPISNTQRQWHKLWNKNPFNILIIDTLLCGD